MYKNETFKQKIILLYKHPDKDLKIKLKLNK